MIIRINQHVTSGFTLVEMTVVLVIVGLLLTGLILPISAQIEMQAYRQTNKNLEEIREALIGYAMINGRLPCPATAASSGLEEPLGGGACTAKVGSNFAVGYLPAATLGITPTDDLGFAIDGWGRNVNNRIRYAVATQSINAVDNPFTSSQGMRNATISSISSNSNFLKICTSAPTGTTCGGVQLSNTAVFVVYSVGKNAGVGGAAGDEAANPNPLTADADGNGVPDADDGIFVSQDPSPNFDDVVLWTSTPTLISRMIAAGKLP